MVDGVLSKPPIESVLYYSEVLPLLLCLHDPRNKVLAVYGPLIVKLFDTSIRLMRRDSGPLTFRRVPPGPRNVITLGYL